MNLEEKYRSYIQNAKHSPSGKELINIAMIFFGASSDKSAAAYIHHALKHNKIKKHPTKRGHYTI